MSFCSINLCGKNSRTSSTKKDGITFHRFPKGPKRKSRWIDAASRGEGWFPKNTSVVCSRHFTGDSFHYMKGRRRLMDTAVPTLQLPVLASNNKSADIKDFQVAGPEKDPLLLKSSISSSPKSQDALQLSNAKNETDCSETSTMKRNVFSNTPSTYDPTKSRLCRRIVELKNTVQRKNKTIRNLRDCNRRLMKQIASLKLLLDDKYN